MSRLKEVRKSKGWTQGLLSYRSGVSVRLIQSYEQRQRNINNASAVTVNALAEALGCSVGDLLEDDGVFDSNKKDTL